MRDRYCQQTCGQTTSAQVIRKIRFAACSDEVRKKSTACRRSLDACSDDVFKPSIAFLNWREARIWSSACPTSISGAGVGWVSFEPTPAAGAGVPAPGMLTGGSAGPAARNRSAKSAHPNKRSRRPPRPASLSGRCPDREGNVHEDAHLASHLSPPLRSRVYDAVRVAFASGLHEALPVAPRRRSSEWFSSFSSRRRTAGLPRPQRRTRSSTGLERDCQC